MTTVLKDVFRVLSSSVKNVSSWNTAAFVVWAMTFVGLALRTLTNPNRATAFTVYRLAGSHWLHGEHLYGDWRGFVYAPLVAAFFSPFSYLSPSWGNLCWTWFNTAIFLLGVAAILHRRIYPDLERKHYGIVYLLILPLALGNLDTGQANPALIGLMLLAVAAVHSERWSLVALCVAIATYTKIYPLALGLLIFAIAPRKFGWRLLLALLVLGCLPFIFQHWSYVSQQYHEWIATRSADDRRLYPLKDVPLDLWFLLVRFGHLPVPGFIYTLFQVLSGGAIALYCVAGVWRNWARERILVGLLSLVSIWMTLCGPATELQTYILLAPVVVLAGLEALVRPLPFSLRAGMLCTYSLLLLAVARMSFLPNQKSLWIFTIQPVAAIIFLACCLAWFLNDSFWRTNRSP